MGSLDGSEIQNAPFQVSASCHRVPVIDGHTMAVWADTRAPVADVIEAYRTYTPPISGLPHLPAESVHYAEENSRPQPRLDRNRGGGMTVSVGRIREGLRYVAMGHNTIRGAAGASVLNAELIVSKKYV